MCSIHNTICVPSSLAVSDPSQQSPVPACPSGQSSSTTNQPRTIDLMDANDGAEQPWHHGAVPRAQANSLLKTNGDFLVRTSTKQNKLQAVLSVMWNNTPQHVTVHKTINNKVTLYPDDPSATNQFDSLTSLINYYLNSKRALPNVDYVLTRAVRKDGQDGAKSAESEPQPVLMSANTPGVPKSKPQRFKSRGSQKSMFTKTKRCGPTYGTGTSKHGSASVPTRVEDEEWYHGLMPRDDINKMLVRRGDFLVRYTEVNGQRRFVISVWWDGQVHHVVLHKLADGKVTIDPRNPNDNYLTISELVRHYYTRSEPLAQWGYILMNPIPRQPWELRHEQIVLGKKLGSGAFGEVFMGYFTEAGSRAPPKKVAVKRSHADVLLSKEQIIELVAESRVMQQLAHKNIVNFYGVAAEQQPLMIIMELVSGGSLDKYLQDNTSNVTVAQRIKYCADSSAGLAYLHGMKVLHRDIAARNCLIDTDETIKISDFGLATEGTNFQQTKNTKLPIRWLAPETLKSGGMFSLHSDIWSFGILCWEIFHNAVDPYPGMKVLEVAGMVKDGRSMDIDDDALIPEKIKPTIKSCWRPDPETRPDMKTLAAEIDRLR